jgi:hypothetical protein
MAIVSFPSLMTVAPGIAAEPDYPCYFTTVTRETINLTQSICQQKTLTNFRNDQAFLNEYRRFSAGNDISLGLASDDPQFLIDSARRYCEGRQAGRSADAIAAAAVRQIEADDPNVRAAIAASLSVVNNLAQKYYCPQLAQQR